VKNEQKLEKKILFSVKNEQKLVFVRFSLYHSKQNWKQIKNL
jgi:hypothetical protein